MNISTTSRNKKADKECQASIRGWRMYIEPKYNNFYHNSNFESSERFGEKDANYTDDES